MELEDYIKLKEQLERDGVFITRSRLQYFAGGAVGGAIALLVAAGLLSAESAKHALDAESVKIAEQTMKQRANEITELALEAKKNAGLYQEINLPSLAGTGTDGWKDVLKLKPQSAIKIEAYTSENNYIQPWVIYVWRAYEQQNAGKFILPIPPQHPVSSMVEWTIEDSGTLKIRRTPEAPNGTATVLRITRLEVLRGEGADIFVPLKADTSVKDPRV